MTSIIAALIAILLIVLAVLLAKRKHPFWAGVSIVLAIICGLTIFWSNSDISDDDSGPNEVVTVPASQSS